jgi:hypothetical protein
MRFRTGDPNWIAAVTRARIDRLPGAPRPTWRDWLEYERSLLAAVLLVGLCLYATAISPAPRIVACDDPAS